MAEELDLLIEDTDEENDVAVTINYDIATYPSDFTLAGIAQMWKDEDIKIPGFSARVRLDNPPVIALSRFLFVWLACTPGFLLHQ